MTFGKRLKAARTAKGLTQEQLGKGLGTDGKDATKAVVYGWEKDQHYPRVDQLALICEKLNVSADQLLFGRTPTETLSTPVADVAIGIEKLTPLQREWAIPTVWQTIEVAKQILPPSALTVTDENLTIKDSSHPLRSSNGRR